MKDTTKSDMLESQKEVLWLTDQKILHPWVIFELKPDDKNKSAEERALHRGKIPVKETKAGINLAFL